MKHKTRLKVMINPILRFLQFRTDRPWVIVSKFNKGTFVGYSFKRVKYYKG